MNRSAVQPASKAAAPLAHASLQRKCACGSHTMGASTCASCEKKKRPLQAKLRIGDSDDPFEHEADRVSEQVLSAPSGTAAPRIRRVAAGLAPAADGAPDSVDRVLAGPGKPLEAPLRSDMEQRFGHDFSRVRVHADGAAARSAGDIDARAYTAGHQLVFGAGQFAPSTREGRRLLAHELTHVIQQGGCGGAMPARRAMVQRKPGASLPTIRRLLRERGFFERDVSEADTHQVLQLFKAMPPQDLRDTVRSLEDQDKGYVDRLLEYIGAADRDAELATLRAIANARVSKAETRNTGTTVSTEVVSSCTIEQYRVASEAANIAVAWLDTTIRRLDAYIAAPADAANAAVGAALYQHFGRTGSSTSADVLEHVRVRLANIRGDLRDAQQLSLECHGAWDPECPHAAAYAPGNHDPDIVLCESFFYDVAQGRAETLVHETAHMQGGGEHIRDLGYARDRIRKTLLPAEALTNAESYGLFVQQIGTGRVQDPQAPRDTAQDCPPEWEKKLKPAVAAAQRWNRNLQVRLAGMTPGGLRAPPDWTSLLGGATQGHIDKAKAAIDRVASKLDSPVSFQCEPKGGGRCKTEEIYWYALGDLHVCPKWTDRGDTEERTKPLLSGLYGYFGGVDDFPRRKNYAQLAKEYTELHFPEPSLQQVLGAASAWTPNNLRIEVEPVVPEGVLLEYQESLLLHQRLSAELPRAQLAPAGAGRAENFEMLVRFVVDGPTLIRRFPFTMPEVGVRFRYASADGNIDDNRRDLHPRYSAGRPLRTFGPRFAYRIAGTGTMTMRFELRDPDTSTTLVYDDTLQLAVAP